MREPMRSWEAAVEAERLRLSPPDAVYAYLSGLGAPEGLIDENLPDAIFDALASRNDPLIDIGLARFASPYGKVAALWDRSPIVRLAMLGNRNRGAVFPTDDVAGLIGGCTDDELGAMLTNPRTSPFVLAHVFANDIKLPPDRWRKACLLASLNERLTYVPEADTWSEFTDSRDHAKPINEFWNLLVRAEPTKEWAAILQRGGRLAFDTSLPKEFGPERGEGDDEAWSQEFSARYRAFNGVLLKVVTEKWKDPEGQADRTLGPNFWVRAGFAESVTRTLPHDAMVKGFEDHPDQAFRLGFYRGTRVQPGWPVQRYFERDGLEFIDAAIWNESLYERRNHAEQSLVNLLANDRENADDFRLNWIKDQLARLTERDPVRYGDEPTDAMREEILRREAEESRRESAKIERQRQEADRVASGKRPSTGRWKTLAMWIIGLLLAGFWLMTR